MILSEKHVKLAQLPSFTLFRCNVNFGRYILFHNCPTDSDLRLFARTVVWACLAAPGTSSINNNGKNGFLRKRLTLLDFSQGLRSVGVRFRRHGQFDVLNEKNGDVTLFHCSRWYVWHQIGYIRVVAIACGIRGWQNRGVLIEPACTPAKSELHVDCFNFKNRSLGEFELNGVRGCPWDHRSKQPIARPNWTTKPHHLTPTIVQ